MSVHSGAGASPPIHRLAVPTPFPVGDVNAYLIDAHPLTLVDCGPLTDEAWDALNAAVEHTGRALRDVGQLVLTHPHEDHAGLAERVRRVSGCAVHAHPADLRRLLDLPGEWDALADFAVDACRRAGAPQEHLEVFTESLADFRSHSEPLASAAGLEEGDALGVEYGGAGWEFRVLHTPGHTRGSVCLWQPSTCELLSGDTLLGRISSNALLECGAGGRRVEALPRYLETLQRLAGLATRRVLPGHGEEVEGDVKGLVEGRVRFHEKRAAKILGLVRSGVSTPWALADRLFPGLPPSMVFLAVSEVVGHLDLLAERGELAFSGQRDDWDITPP